MRTITLRNDFHNTEVRVRLADGVNVLSYGQTLRVMRELCGVNGCTCAAVRGPQEVGWEFDVDEEGRAVLRIFD